MSYDEREAALFGSSSSGSEYDTEDALSQPTTDDDCVGHVAGATVPSRDRAQSPVTVRYGGPHSPAPRRPRSLFPVPVRWLEGPGLGAADEVGHRVVVPVRWRAQQRA